MADVKRGFGMGSQREKESRENYAVSVSPGLARIRKAEEEARPKRKAKKKPKVEETSDE